VHNPNDAPAQSVQIDASAEPIESTETSDADDYSEHPWQLAVNVLLNQAATLCVQHGVDVDAFMNGAWSCYVEAQPGMRQRLEEDHLRSQLEELRKLGRLAAA
jgi:hypothetical protein